MRIVFIGCVEFSREMLKHLLAIKEAEVCGIVTRRQSAINADFCSLEPLALELGIPCLCADGNDQEKIGEWMAGLAPDAVFCFGWSYLLRPEVIGIPRFGTLGYHPAALPHNRGRHPIIWALALGLPETASTFFCMDAGADSGDIVSQVTVVITEEDDAATLYRKLIVVAKEQLSTFVTPLANGTLKAIPQDDAQANYWRKRSKADGLIDWRMSARAIHNLVRALTRPYPGAHCCYRGAEVKVWRTRLENVDMPNIEPGKVLATGGGMVTVKCGDAALTLVDHGFDVLPAKGEYLG